jgi:hypothetical protein
MNQPRIAFYYPPLHQTLPRQASAEVQKFHCFVGTSLRVTRVSKTATQSRPACGPFHTQTGKGTPSFRNSPPLSPFLSPLCIPLSHPTTRTTPSFILSHALLFPNNMQLLTLSTCSGPKLCPCLAPGPSAQARPMHEITFSPDQVKHLPSTADSALFHDTTTEFSPLMWRPRR